MKVHVLTYVINHINPQVTGLVFHIVIGYLRKITVNKNNSHILKC